MLIDSVVELGVKLLDRVIPDPVQKAQAQLELMKLQQSGELQQITGQLEINKTEAANSSVFVSGWRPSIGWICSAALAYQYLFRPIAMWIGAWTGHVMPPMPGLDDNLWQLLLGMLGLGGLRTFEKINGVSK